MPVHAGLFFVYGGLTLVIDDIGDVSLRFADLLDRLSMKARKSSRALQSVHLSSSLASIYILICGVLWFLQNGALLESLPLWAAYNIFYMSSLLVTSISGLKAVREGLWFTKSTRSEV